MNARRKFHQEFPLFYHNIALYAISQDPRRSTIVGAFCVSYDHRMEERTIFHKIRDKEIPADIVYEDDHVLAFKDIHPKAPTHVLFVPKTFVSSIAECHGDQEHIPGLLIETARKFAAEKGIDGYKLTFHVGAKGGQEIMYVHLHFLSEQKLLGSE